MASRAEECPVALAGAKAEAPTARRAVIPKANFIFKRVVELFIELSQEWFFSRIDALRKKIEVSCLEKYVLLLQYVFYTSFLVPRVS